MIVFVCTSKKYCIDLSDGPSKCYESCIVIKSPVYEVAVDLSGPTLVPWRYNFDASIICLKSIRFFKKRAISKQQMYENGITMATLSDNRSTA